MQFEPFEPGTEDQAIASFIDDLRELEPDAVERDDDDVDDDAEDVRTLRFWRP